MDSRIILKDLKRIGIRESLYSLDELIDLSSRKDINDNGDLSRDVIEITLCLANEIKRISRRLDKIENKTE